MLTISWINIEQLIQGIGSWLLHTQLTKYLAHNTWMVLAIGGLLAIFGRKKIKLLGLIIVIIAFLLFRYAYRG